MCAFLMVVQLELLPPWKAFSASSLQSLHIGSSLKIPILWRRLFRWQWTVNNPVISCCLLSFRVIMDNNCDDLSIVSLLSLHSVRVSSMLVFDPISDCSVCQFFRYSESWFTNIISLCFAKNRMVWRQSHVCLDFKPSSQESQTICKIWYSLGS